MAERNKIVLSDGRVLIDLTSDTVTPNTLLVGSKAHDASGAIIDGECTYDADTSDANATASEILSGRSAYVAGNKIQGSMPNRSGVHEVIDNKEDVITISQGYHDGSGNVKIDATEKAKIIGSNIKSGIQILGVVGTYSGEAVTAQAKSATPSWAQQVVTPDPDYDYLSQVTVAAIPYSEVPNAQGGLTVTIG